MARRLSGAAEQPSAQLGLTRRLLLATSVPSTLTAFLLPYARHFRAAGWRVDAVSAGVTGCSACQPEFDNLWDVNWSRNPLAPQNLTSVPAQLRKLVEREDYDIVHVHDPVAAFVTRYSLRKLRRASGTRVFYTAHGFHFHQRGSPLGNAAFIALEKLAGRWTDQLIVINREDEAAARRFGLVPAVRLNYLPGIGVDLNAYGPGSVSVGSVEAVRQELGLRAGQPLLLLIAELNPGKRHRDALSALARLPDQTAVLAFAGSGPEEARLREYAEQLGLATRVLFLGYRSDIPVLLKAATVTLLPSEREGLPRSIMESMSMGTPVVASRIRGISELLAGDAGLMHEPGDVAALAGAVSLLLREPQRRQLLAANAAVRIRAFDLAPLLLEHEKLYQDA